jgi:cytochrome c5
MYRFVCIAIFGLCFAGCPQVKVDAPPEALPESNSTAVTPSQSENLDISGVQAYQLACASCHESGSNGAPATGDSDAWSGRSPHWEAVLFNHAKEGYMQMPARGGKPELSDRSVVAAAEYMLSITYPDRPPD